MDEDAERELTYVRSRLDELVKARTQGKLSDTQQAQWDALTEWETELLRRIDPEA